MMKRRILKYLLISLSLLILGGLWAFSTFFFNPFEDRYPYDLASLIPREVDFYVSKGDLRNDFDPLPRPAFADDLEADEYGQAFLQLESVAGFLDGLALEETMAPLEEALAQLPVRTEPLAIFGGADLAIAGNFKGRALADSDWAIYGRANWMGKLGVELISSGLIDLGAQGFTLNDLEGGVSLSGGQLTRTLFITRILDVIVVSTTQELMDRALAFEASRGEDSFGQSAKYFDHIKVKEGDEDDLELFVDYRALSDTLGIPGTWPDARSEDLTTTMLGKLFQAGTIRELLGTIRMGTGVTVQATGMLSSELLTPFQKRFYRQSGYEKAEILELAKMVPADVGMFVAMRGPLGELLRQAVPSMEEAAVSNIEDVIRGVWGYADVYPLIEDLDAAFKDRLAFFMRNNDYPADSGDQAPIANNTPVPAWAVVLMIDDSEALEKLRLRIVQRQDAFSIRGREAGTKGVFENVVAGGGKIYEYHIPLIPGTGHLATLVMSGPGSAKYFVLSNSHRFLGSVFTTYRRRETPRLSEQNWFQTLVNAGLGSVDMVAWFNPRAMADTSRAIAAYNAEIDVLDAIDWRVERPRIEKLVIKEHFPDETWGAITPANEDSFELIVKQELDRFQIEFNSEHVGLLRSGYERNVKAWELAEGVLLELALEQKRFELYGRVVVKLDG